MKAGDLWVRENAIKMKACLVADDDHWTTLEGYAAFTTPQNNHPGLSTYQLSATVLHLPRPTVMLSFITLAPMNHTTL